MAYCSLCGKLTPSGSPILNDKYDMIGYICDDCFLVNLCQSARRSIKKEEEAIPVPLVSKWKKKAVVIVKAIHS